MITLNQQQIQQIEGMINEMPGKFAIPLLSILNQAHAEAQERLQEPAPAQEVEKPKK